MNQQHYYEYTSASIEFSGFCVGQPKSNYLDAIREHAAHGWRLHQMVVIPGSEGGAKSLELIFERPARGPQDLMRADDDEPDAADSTDPAVKFQQPAGERPPWTPWSGPIP